MTSWGPQAHFAPDLLCGTCSVPRVAEPPRWPAQAGQAAPRSVLWGLGRSLASTPCWAPPRLCPGRVSGFWEAVRRGFCASGPFLALSRDSWSHRPGVTRKLPGGSCRNCAIVTSSPKALGPSELPLPVGSVATGRKSVPHPACAGEKGVQPPGEVALPGDRRSGPGGRQGTGEQSAGSLPHSATTARLGPLTQP